MVTATLPRQARHWIWRYVVKLKVCGRGGGGVGGERSEGEGGREGE